MINSWEINKEDQDLIMQIADRACKLVKSLEENKLTLIMDLSSVHLNDGPLDLPGLLNGTDFDLVHDTVGIINNIDRNTGKLHRFAPRYAKRN